MSGKQQHTLSFREGSPADVGVGPAVRAAGTQITLRVSGLDRRRAAEWLADVARFAPGAVLVDGVSVVDGFRDVLLQARLPAPLRGGVALVAEGDTAHAYLLAHGLVTAHISIPEAPGFEAAVELATPRARSRRPGCATRSCPTFPPSSTRRWR